MVDWKKAESKWGKLGYMVFGSPLRVIVTIVLLTVVGFGLKLVLLPAQTAKEIVEKTLDADNVIYNYEWFKQTKEDVEAIDKKIKNAQESYDSYLKICGPQSGWGFEEKTEAARLNTVVLGLKNQREDMVATYNARSNMANREIFKTGELPEKLQ